MLRQLDFASMAENTITTYKFWPGFSEKSIWIILAKILSHLIKDMFIYHRNYNKYQNEQSKYWS